MLQTIHDCNLEQIVDFPTREQNTLDLFLTNRPALVNRSKPLPGISDHEIVLVDSNIKAKRQKPPARKILLWKRADLDALHRKVQSSSEEIVTNHTIDSPVEDLWQEIRSSIEEITNECIPSKTTTTRYSQPWINTKIKQRKRKKQKWYNRAKKTNSVEAWQEYKEQKKAMQRECRRAHCHHVRDIICGEYESGNKKRFWGYIKSLRRDSCGVSPLKKGGRHLHRKQGKG
jgi:hypothetical protein